MAAGDSLAGTHGQQTLRASSEGTSMKGSMDLHPLLHQDDCIKKLREGSTEAAVPAFEVMEKRKQTVADLPNGATGWDGVQPQCKATNTQQPVQEGSHQHPPSRSDATMAPGDLSSSNLPPRFLDFLHLHGIDPSLYVAAASVPRHIRIRPLDAGSTRQDKAQHDLLQGTEQGYTQRSAVQEGPSTRRKILNPSPADVAAVEEDLGVPLEPLPWLPGFFSLPPNFPIAGTRSYKTGRIFGMDAASGAAVAALDIQEGDHVLDLCAAPGAKLAMMADILGQGSGTLTAVDISLPRLAATKTVLVKYKVADRCRLFLGDATRFSVPPPLPNLDAQRRGGRRWESTPQPSSEAGQGHGSGIAECREGPQGEGVAIKESSEKAKQEEEATGPASEGLELLAMEYGMRLTQDTPVCNESRPASETDDAGPGTGDALGASPIDTTELKPVASQPDGASVEAPARRKKTRNERRRARKLRQFTAYLPEASSALSLPSTSGVLPEGSLEGARPSVEAARQHGHGLEARQGQRLHPELYFVGRKAWQWWDPSRDAAEPTSTSGKHSEVGVAGNAGALRLYDKVLVDAECTHDGSVKHVLKFEEWGWETLDRRFLDSGRLSQLSQLQRGLLDAGFKLLKPEGLLVYCTCSLTRTQNEDIVEGFLASHADASVLPVHGASEWSCKAGGVSNTLRFDPTTSSTGGLFVALLTKR